MLTALITLFALFMAGVGLFGRLFPQSLALVRVWSLFPIPLGSFLLWAVLG